MKLYLIVVRSRNIQNMLTRKYERIPKRKKRIRKAHKKVLKVSSTQTDVYWRKKGMENSY